MWRCLTFWSRSAEEKLVRTCVRQSLVPAALALAWAPVFGNAQQQGPNLTDYLQIVEESPAKGAKGEARRVGRVEIDSMLRFVWDEKGLLTHLSSLVDTGTKGSTEDLSVPMGAMKTAADLLLRAQKAELAFRIARLQALGSPAEGPESQAKGQVAQAALRDLQVFRSEATGILKGQKGPGSQFALDLAAALSGPPDEGFAALQESAVDIAREVTNKLERNIRDAPKARLYMSAFLVTQYGKWDQVHLEGYDTLAPGKPTPFPRNRLVIDSRTLGELAAAQQAVSLLQAFRNIELQQTLARARSAARSAVQRLSNRLNISELESECGRLIDEAKQRGDEAIPLLKSVRDVQAVLHPLSRHNMFGAQSEAAALEAFASLLTDFTRDFWEFARSVPNLLETLVKEIVKIERDESQSRTAERMAFLGRLADFRTFFESFRRDLLGGQVDSEISALTETLNDTSEALLLTKEFTLVPKDLLARSIGDGDPLDTELNVKSIPGTRRPGDRIVIRARVALQIADGGDSAKSGGQDLSSQGGAPDRSHVDEKTVDEGEETRYLEAYGGYWQSTGQLLFVDPRSRIGRSLSYEPTVGLGFNYHFGIKGADRWNSEFNPGLGVTFSMLDFNDDSRFELGAALGLTLFNDFVSIGYGRNLNVGGEYFYLGFNPYALTRLFRKR